MTQNLRARVDRADIGCGPNRGTFDARDPRILCQSQTELSAGIASVIEAADGKGHAPQKASTWRVAPWVLDFVRAEGVDMDAMNHVIDGSAVRHIRKNHSSTKTETARGQVAITDSDIQAIPEVFANPDAVAVGHRTKLGRDAIIYAKSMADGTTMLVEELHSKRGEAAVQSLRKIAGSAAKDDKALARLLLSNARSDGGASPRVAIKPAISNRYDQTRRGSIQHPSTARTARRRSSTCSRARTFRPFP